MVFGDGLSLSGTAPIYSSSLFELYVRFQTKSAHELLTCLWGKGERGTIAGRLHHMTAQLPALQSVRTYGMHYNTSISCSSIPQSTPHNKQHTQHTAAAAATPLPNPYTQ